jgi:hypothetical protein
MGSSTVCALSCIQGDGVTTPGSKVKVGIATVRGTKSFGMICSAYDLGWMEEANGWAAELPESFEAGDALGASAPKVTFHWLIPPSTPPACPMHV